MKLTRLQVENFRSIKEMDLTFPDSGLLVLVGPNNAGKSNLIRAVEALCGESWFGKDKVEQHDYYCRDATTPIELKIDFDNGCRVQWSSQPDGRWPEYLDQSGKKQYGRNIKDDFPCTYLGADRSIDKHMSFYDWTLIGKIRKHFHRKAKPLKDQLEEKFEEIVALFDQVEGFSAFTEGFTDCFAALQADTASKLSIGFKPYTPSNYFKTMQILSADPTQGDDKLALEELGEGTRNLVLIALLWSYAVHFRQQGEMTGILALEEPEIFLHPHARRHLFRVLREIAASGHQVIVSTHSASFLETELFDSIGRVIKVPDRDNAARSCTSVTLVSKQTLVAYCQGTGVPAKKVSTASVAPYYRATANPKLNEAFFARYLVLTEGETEELALREYLAHLGLDCDLLGVSVLGVHGKSQLPRYWRLFSAFGIPTTLVLDNDDDETGDKRSSNQIVADALGLPLMTLLDGVNVCKQVAGTLGAKPTALVLEGDFEGSLKKDFGIWAGEKFDGCALIGQWEGEARQLLKLDAKQGKPLIARFVARRLLKHHAGFRPACAQQLAGLVSGHLGIPLPIPPPSD